MKLSDGQKDVLEDLLKHRGFDVLEELVASERERLLDRLQADLDVAMTAKVRGELWGLSYVTREALEKRIRDTP